MNLTEFLLARLDEDEAAAERAIRRNKYGDVISYHSYRHQIAEADRPRGAVAVPAPGFLAECEAKRRIVEQYQQAFGDDEVLAEWNDGYLCGQEFALKVLALPYADHPDYRQEWKP